MRKWTRWQDWVALVAGVCAILAPFLTTSTTKATWTMVVLGAVTAVVSLYSLAMPGERDLFSEGAHVILGILLFISPWVMGFASMTTLATTAWIVGFVTFAAGLWVLYETGRLRRHPAAAS